jgi:crotonobetainyl-CoA:carnitine CoA-transferase CaiB-like acyl-CoA transferase
MIAERRHRPSPTRGPLAGVRVIELAAMVSGPLATSILADQGADVIKVEAPGVGDAIRRMGSSRGGVSAIFSTVNRSKRSLVVDVRTPRGRDVVRRLADGADVFVQNFRPGAVEELGLGEAELRGRNPGLIYVSISGFGRRGPYASHTAYDIVIQALSGMAAVQGECKMDKTDDPEGTDKTRKGGAPTFMRTVVCDKITAVHAAQAISAALLARERGAGGQHIEISLLDASVAFLWPDGMETHTYVGEGVTAPATMWGLVGIYQTRDGWMTFLAINDEEFRGLCAGLGRPELAVDERFVALDGRLRNSGALIAIIRSAIAAETTGALCERLRREGVPCAPVLAPEAVHDDPQVRAVELIAEIEHPVTGRVRMPRAVSQFEGTPLARPTPAPMLGEHTDEVLAELGLSSDAIHALRRDGIVGP